MKHQLRSLLLFLAALIWGIAFVAQSVGMEYIEPFTFNCVRNLIGSVVLIPCILFLDRWNLSNAQARERTAQAKRSAKKTLWTGGFLCGAALFAGTSFQQFGILYASVGKAGFLTALYIVMVPLLGVFLGRKPEKKLWLAVALAILGMYLLCMKPGAGEIGAGDALLLAGALCFSFHILIVDKYANLVDCVRLAAIQFLVCGLLSGAAMLLFEAPAISAILSAWAPVLYAGVLSCGVAYTLQIVGQRGTNPVVATLVLSLESVVSVLSGWLILGQVLSAREITGCVIVFAAILLAQLPKRGEIAVPSNG